MVVGEGFEPSKQVATDLQSAPFGHSGTPPNGAGNRNRTYNLLITSQLLYRWAMPAHVFILFLMVVTTGIEPVTPCL